EHPMVVRPARHSRGRDVNVCYSWHHILTLSLIYGEGNYYVSPLIPKIAEYRVFVVSGRAVAVARKTPGNPDDVAWNVARGGRFDNVRWGEWPLKAVRVAIEAFNMSDLDFGGVDIM